MASQKSRAGVSLNDRAPMRQPAVGYFELTGEELAVW